MSQIFQKEYPKDHFFLFLDFFVRKKINKYIFSKVAYKKIQLRKTIRTFFRKFKKLLFSFKISLFRKRT